eukprot:snap_masked-scaffold_9-processed-gene-12.38-mRNA-1 protein AED:1.00 eAED:1.00 QI:0/-1/0/0/-1/1/1/0/262
MVRNDSIPQENPSWSAQQRTMADRLFYAHYAQTEEEVRNDLVTAHQLVAKYHYDDLVWNHISARVKNEKEQEESYLITPGGLHFSQVKADDLVFERVLDSGNIIHNGIYQKRPDVNCILHTHTIPIMAVGCLKVGFKFLTQDSAPFLNKIGYHDWEGWSTSEEEKERIGNNLGDGIALLMRNHGATIVGRNVQEAFVRLYYLDRCCRVQLEAMKAAGGDELIECSEEILEIAADQIEKYFPHGKYEWSALRRLVGRNTKKYY